ncbi:hypothetical protein [Dyadobacter luticola]|uniref:Lipocalin-like domain-containing protein n=1 Tax=Dyadobacter luticola TaxID=1979387 RepID=A0A5R9KYG1_9BACT|nr:hypothetical protein [Dyadobacter luticola]TLV01198.1 hypothetical protein FEN17_17270 [Dyadobacter luticola]
MKRLLYLPLFLTLFFACKKDSMDSAYDAANIQTIAGPWRLVEVEKTSLANQRFWEKVPANQSDTLVFRSDGVILNGDGTPRCCAPNSLLINGAIMEIKPQSAIPANPICFYVSCVNCPTWELTWTDDTLIISSCLSGRTKYVR